MEGALRGTRAFTADIPAARALHLHFVTSMHAHARIGRVEVDGATAAPGVVAVFTAETLPVNPIHEIPMIPETFAQPPLASEVVRFVGEYVAAVVATSPSAAADAAERVVVDYDRIPAVVDVDAALDPGAPRLFPDHGTNIALEWEQTSPGWDAATASAVTVHAEVVLPRVAVTPIETRAVLAVPHPDGTLTLWCSTQSPHWTRTQIARSLCVGPEAIRVVAPPVGGGFGGKANGGVAAYVVAAAAARSLGRSVRFVEPRADNLASMQGRGLRLTGTLHVDPDGTIRAVEIAECCDAGAYPSTGAVEPGKTALMACGPYRVPAVRFTARSVATNRAPTGAYRGPGRSEAAAILEHLLDRTAAATGIDPVAIRRVNLLRSDELPLATVAGAHYDPGDYPAVLDALCARVDYAQLRRDQAARNDMRGPVARGIGVSTVLDSTAWFARQEPARVNVGPDGTVQVVCGTADCGQLHARAFATIVAEVLPVDVSEVVVVEGDSDAIDESGGTSGSRSLQLAGSAIHAAATEVWEQVREIAAELMEAAPDDVVVTTGRIAVRGVPSRTLALADIAAHAAVHGPALDARCVVDQSGATYTAAAHCCVVDVDIETGAITPIRHVAVTDCGHVVDLPVATGQVVGATVQGIAQVLAEECVVDENGNPLGTNLVEYPVPSAAEMPGIDATFVDSASPMNVLGARGVGEVGMVGAPPAIHAAVLDALRPFGVEHLELPCTPERVWRALRDAGRHHPVEH